MNIYLEKGIFLLFPNLDTLSINGDIGNSLDVFFTLDLDSGYFEGLELPNLKTIKIRNYEDNILISILKKQFPNIEIVIESYKEEIEIDEATKEELERLMIEQGTN